MTNQNPNQVNYEDVLGCQVAVFEWAESFDSKDWDRLLKCLAPTLHVDYRTIMDMFWESMPADDFRALASGKSFLGNPRLKTQHFIGASKFVRTSNEDEIIGYHQMRVAHQKYKDDELTVVLHKGHAHGHARVWYRKVDGVWKFAGLQPEIRWTEYDYGKVFQEDN
ncbi:Scytalone dehydratase [Talaromyces islandicus]|uniref:Scytalone dehydratase n=1 Tax=Talaromyces islandicus TaxID=28573 RepID=A0A0U1LTG6_TALIS|nr:Scytalone dehydratase [Talaromyces islandicus]